MGELLSRIGWSKRHFADLCQVDVRTVHEWCKGDVEPTSYRLGMRYLELVARLLGV
jgi:DNA-binding transcriptional regulator YiaG